MKTESEIRERLEEVESNYELHGGSGNNREQILMGQAIALKWVVEGDE